MPGEYKESIIIKTNKLIVNEVYKNKNVLLIDDSIVRGNTSKQIIQMARDAGANKVYFASASPPIRYPNVYGIDMAATSELVAHGRTEEEICSLIGADWLIYQDLKDLIYSAQIGNPDIKCFETSIFDGKYLTSEVSQGYLEDLENERSDQSKLKRKIFRN